MALDDNCPPDSRRIRVLQYDYTLPELMQLHEMLEIRSALKEASERDNKLAVDKDRAKGKIKR